MMACIYLIRHGQANTQSSNYDQLSDLGIEQSHMLGPYLAQKCLQPNVVTGNMQRHQKTADIAISAGTLKPENYSVDERWNEYNHQAILAGLDEELRTPEGMRNYFIQNQLNKDAFRPLFLKAVNQWIEADENTYYPESWKTFQQRVNEAFEKAMCSTAKIQFIFTSGGPISLIVCRLLSLPPQQFMMINWNLVNTGITKILFNKRTGNISLSCLNEHAILDNVLHQAKITYT
ncbi:MAG: histidine phosphatase family protein [Pseudomonadota bacterium]